MALQRSLGHLALLMMILLCTAMAGRSGAAAPTADDSVYLPMVLRTGHLLDADQAVGGHSLEEAARRTAAFNATRDPANYPAGLPYEILSTSGSTAFTVAPGTFFYVPIVYVSDSPPIIGTFPDTASGAEAYFFGATQVGGHDCFIEVDGVRYELGAAYLAGPITTDPLPDGGGTHYMVLAAFMYPLPPGAHTVVIGGTFDGEALVKAYGEPVEFTITYTIQVL